MTNTYQFVDNYTGENFFVEETTKAKAIETAKIYFKEPEYIRKLDDEYEAEILGYDTY